jgi:phosphoribosylglycinamide formyltransferase-1
MRLGVLASGRGTNLQALIDACQGGRIDAEVVIVLSNVADAPALLRARRHGIPALFIDPREENFEGWLLEALSEARAELICLAGFMRVLSPSFLKAAGVPILNIHPSLLPAFRGLRAQQRALEYGVKVAGCTVHLVDEKVDHGPIVIQAAIPVFEDDTPESLAERILREEHRIYPEAVQFFVEGRVRVEGRRARILPRPP